MFDESHLNRILGGLAPPLTNFRGAVAPNPPASYTPVLDVFKQATTFAQSGMANLEINCIVVQPLSLELMGLVLFEARLL